MDRAEQRKQLLKQAVRLYNEGNPAEALPIYLKCLDLFGDEEHSSLEFADFCDNYGSALAESGNQKLAEKMFTVPRCTPSLFWKVTSRFFT